MEEDIFFPDENPGFEALETPESPGLPKGQVPYINPIILDQRFSSYLKKAFQERLEISRLRFMLKNDPQILDDDREELLGYLKALRFVSRHKLTESFLAARDTP